MHSNFTPLHWPGDLLIPHGWAHIFLQKGRRDECKQYLDLPKYFGVSWQAVSTTLISLKYTQYSCPFELINEGIFCNASRCLPVRLYVLCWSNDQLYFISFNYCCANFHFTWCKNPRTLEGVYFVSVTLDGFPTSYYSHPLSLLPLSPTPLSLSLFPLSFPLPPCRLPPSLSHYPLSLIPPLFALWRFCGRLHLGVRPADLHFRVGHRGDGVVEEKERNTGHSFCIRS